MGNAAVTGTPTSTGGAIPPSSQNQTLTIDGYTVALIGDYASCSCGLPYCKKMGPIIANPATPRAVFYDNIPWALAGDMVDTGCGLCTILKSAHDVMVGPELSSPVHIPAGIIMKIVSGMTFNMGMQSPRNAPSTAAAFQAASTATTTTQSTIRANQAVMASHSATTTHANGAATALHANSTSVNNQTTTDGWKVVQGISPDKPLLVYQTQKKMNDMNAPDLQYGDESKEKIMGYGFLHPFTEDEFTLSAEEHFRRMKGLGDYFSNQTIEKYFLGTTTTDIFYDMVDKFHRKEGGFFHDDKLTAAMKNHETTKHFHEALKTCLQKNIQVDGSLPPVKKLQTITSDYLKHVNGGVTLPKFIPELQGEDLYNGTVLTVHDIWSMHVFVNQLEFKGDQLRGVFEYKIQDHFGLDSNDINHKWNELLHSYERFEGFRSWYILQHLKKEGFGFKPFITEIEFTL